MGMLEGKVVAITGAGRGVGREIALLCAKHGAAVVVNDPGVGGGGDGGDAGPAQQTVDDIIAAGGKAWANLASVADPVGAASIIEDAVQRFGRIDAVVNNAGILRDTIWHKMSHEDWRAVIDVNLNGPFNVCKAATPYFREQQSGSFIHFTSTSGLIGNIGQANYAAAKLGVMGLSRIVAMEGLAKNVRSNIIAPFAWTRMIASIPVKDEASAARVERMKNGMRADQVAQLAVALCADGAKDTSGQIFAVRGNEVFLFNQPRPVRTLGRLEGWTPQTLLEQALPALKANYTDPGASASVFPYDPV
ncbi:MAG: SDR family oxidoreductase [Hyphomonadaceae bacterium]|nr:SDR family oxidoreductase [Hyphomonadaceae bacterium]